MGLVQNQQIGFMYGSIAYICMCTYMFVNQQFACIISAPQTFYLLYDCVIYCTLIHLYHFTDPIYSIELESFLFGLSQRRRWIRIAEYVGFEREEIDTWDKGTQQGALTFFEKWRLPDCGPLNDEMISMLATNTDLHYSIHQPAAGTGLGRIKGCFINPRLVTVL